MPTLVSTFTCRRLTTTCGVLAWTTAKINSWPNASATASLCSWSAVIVTTRTPSSMRVSTCRGCGSLMMGHKPRKGTSHRRSLTRFYEKHKGEEQKPQPFLVNLWTHPRVPAEGAIESKHRGGVREEVNDKENPGGFDADGCLVGR